MEEKDGALRFYNIDYNKHCLNKKTDPFQDVRNRCQASEDDFSGAFCVCRVWR